MMHARFFRKVGAYGRRVRRLSDTAVPNEPKQNKANEPKQNNGWRRVDIASVAAAVSISVAVFGAVYAAETTHWWKKQKAVWTICTPFKKKHDRMQKPVPREKLIQELKQRLAVEDSRTTVVAGQHQIGKSWLMDSALDGQKGVVRVLVNRPDWQKELYKSVGLDDFEIFAQTLAQAAKKLGVLPIIYIDVPRDSPVNMHEVSHFCKELVTDREAARAVVVASQVSLAMGFDAGGEERQFNVMIGGLSHEEAVQYIVDNFANGVTESEADLIVRKVGMCFGALLRMKHLMDGPANSKALTLDTALKEYNLKCTRDVILVSSTVSTSRSDHKTYKVGQIIMEALVRGEVCNDAFLFNSAGGTNYFTMANALANGRAHAITYDIIKNCWAFSSPMHEEAARNFFINKRRGLAKLFY